MSVFQNYSTVFYWKWSLWSLLVRRNRDLTKYNLDNSIKLTRTCGRCFVNSFGKLLGKKGGGLVRSKLWKIKLFSKTDLVNTKFIVNFKSVFISIVFATLFEIRGILIHRDTTEKYFEIRHFYLWSPSFTFPIP